MSTNNTYLAIFLGSRTSARNDGMERPSRNGAASKATRGNCCMEGVGRKAPGQQLSAWVDRSARPSKSLNAGIEDVSNEHGSLHGRKRGIA